MSSSSLAAVALSEVVLALKAVLEEVLALAVLAMLALAAACSPLLSLFPCHRCPSLSSWKHPISPHEQSLAGCVVVLFWVVDIGERAVGCCHHQSKEPEKKKKKTKIVS
jgi:hypothetical protein